MDTGELKKECEDYLTHIIKNNYNLYWNCEMARKFSRGFNNDISDEVFLKIEDAYFEIVNSKDGELGVQDIVNLTLKFLNTISKKLGDRFVSDIKKNLISINKNNPKDACNYYFSVTDGEKKHYQKVFVRHTGTLRDVTTLVHEYFHLLTDVSGYKNDLDLTEYQILCTQEWISILSELVCSRYLYDLNMEDALKVMYFRVYDAIYFNVRGYSNFIDYYLMLKNGASLDDIQKKYDISVLRKWIDEKEFSRAMMYYFSSVSAIFMIADNNLEQLLELLRDIFAKIENREFEKIEKQIPKKFDSLKFAEFVSLDELPGRGRK